MLLFLVVALLSSSCSVDAVPVVDATAWAQDSPDPSMKYAVGFTQTGEISFFWNAVDNILHAKLVHIVDENPPSFIGFGIYDDAQTEFTGSENVFAYSDWVVGNPTDGTIKKYRTREADNMGAAQEADQTLRSGSISQFQYDGRYATVMEFEKLIEEDSSEDIRIHKFCENVLLWVEGPPGGASGISMQAEVGAFTLDFGAVEGHHENCGTEVEQENEPEEEEEEEEEQQEDESESVDSGVSTDTSSDSVATEWLDLHNTYRTAEFAEHGVGNVPLVWSDSLAAASQEWADYLVQLDGCGISHDNDRGGVGENIAMASGALGSNVANSPSRAVTMWYEGEKTIGYTGAGASADIQAAYGYPYDNANGHYTQVANRSTKYVGCGQAFKQTEELCAIEVCRYIRPANCNTNEENWLEKMLLEESACGEECPDEGCS